MSNPMAYAAGRLFTGTHLLHDHAALVKNGRIEAVLPAASLPASIALHHFGQAAILCPPFVDLQLYGAYGRLFSAYPDEETVRAIALYSREGGAAYCMPTVATQTFDVVFRCIDAIRRYWANGGKGVLGLHVEGPWINPVKRGAHIESLIVTPVEEQVKALLEYGRGVIRIITLAPEVCTREIIAQIRSYRVVVSAGHSNATYRQAMDGFENGIETVTHLYNAMSGLQHREPGLVGAVFNQEQVCASIVPDGFHVAFAALRIAKKIMGQRLFVITDAVTSTTEGPYLHQLAGGKYESGGVLSGSALTMNQALKNLVAKAGIDLPEAIRMCSLYPARVINLSKEKLLLQAGYPAELLVLDGNLNLVQLIC